MHSKTLAGLNSLRNEILSNKYRYEARFPSEYALMRRLNLGRGAVRAIMQQLRDEKLISGTTRGKSCTSLYQHTAPHLDKKLLFLTCHETIFYNDILFDAQYYGIVQRCAELGYLLEPLHAEENIQTADMIVDYVRQGGYAGVVTTIYPFEESIRRLLQSNIPCVIAGYEAGNTLPCSQMNFREIGHMAGSWLWQHNRTHNVVLSGFPKTWLYKEMLAGFRGALAEEKIFLSDDDVMVVEQSCPLTPEVYQRVNDFFYSKNPDGIFTTRDYRACFAYGYALKYRINIPDNLSIISFDNRSWVVTESVGLSTITEPCALLGSEAVDFLHEWISTSQRPANRVLSGSLIVRRS